MSNQLKFKSEKFVCPHCKILAQQSWLFPYKLGQEISEIYYSLYLDHREGLQSFKQDAIKGFLVSAKSKFNQYFNQVLPTSLSISTCSSCNEICLWIDEDMVYPRSIPIDSPNKDMNQEIQDLYNEAASIFMDSPKGASALLRLALQKLLEQLGETGNINTSIGNLVQRGLSPKIQQALDVIRVVGNNAVHPGEINLDDNQDIALKLFRIINIIAQDMITHPKEIEELYDDVLPEGAKKAIDKRDNQ